MHLNPTIVTEWLWTAWDWLLEDQVRTCLLLACILLFILAFDLWKKVTQLLDEQKVGQKTVIDLLMQVTDLRKGSKMTRKERQRYLRVTIPDLIVDAFETAQDRGVLTKQEVNEHYRKLAGMYKMPDLKAERRNNTVEIVVPSKAKRPPFIHFERVKAAINHRRQGKFRAFWKPVTIPGPPVGEPNGTLPPATPKRGQIFGNVRT